jgi:hypothetical protein
VGCILVMKNRYLSCSGKQDKSIDEPCLPYGLIHDGKESRGLFVNQYTQESKEVAVYVRAYLQLQ